MINEAKINVPRHMQIGSQLHHLFVAILHEGMIPIPGSYGTLLVLYCLQHHSGIAELTNAQVQDYGLFLIDKLLSQSGKSLQDCGCMPRIEGNWEEVFGNRLIVEQREYNTPGLPKEAAECFEQDQSVAFEKINSVVSI